MSASVLAGPSRSFTVQCQLGRPTSAEQSISEFSCLPPRQNADGLFLCSFFSRIRENNEMERSTYFIQATPPEEPLLSNMFRPDTLSQQASPKARDIIVRRERQTFRKLPKSGAVLFAVKTALTPLRDLEQEERLNMAREIRSWPDDIAAYKGRDFWGACVLDFIECGIED